MKLYRLGRCGSTDHLRLHDEPVPQPQRGEVAALVDLRAGPEPKEWMMRK